MHHPWAQPILQRVRDMIWRDHSPGTVLEEHLAEPLPVCEGWLPACWSPSTAKSPLFDLPTEILEHIVDKMSRLDLAAFSLVNSDCRGLVRTRQFASLTIRFDRAGERSKGHSMLAYLCREVRGTLQVADSRLLPIHKSIRYLNIVIGLSHRDLNIFEAPIQRYLGVESQYQYLTPASYTGLLYLIQRLPNLTTFSCRNLPPWTASADLLSRMQLKSLVHLKLVNCEGDDTRTLCRLARPMPRSWPLQTLHLVAPAECPLSAHVACVYMLQAACLNLKRLYLENYDFSRPWQELRKALQGLTLPFLEQLQLVRTQLCPETHHAILDTSKFLVHVKVINGDSATEYYNIPSLTSIHVSNSTEWRRSGSRRMRYHKSFNDLVSNNPQIAAIETSGSSMKRMAVEQFLDMVVSHIPELTSLSFNIRQVRFGQYQMMYKWNWELISRLQRLQRLRISGVTISRRLKHGGVRNCLASLQDLNTLILHDTTCTNESAEKKEEDYRIVVEEVKELSRLLPKLELMALRYYVFRIVRDADGSIEARRLLTPIGDLEKLFVDGAGFKGNTGSWTSAY